MSNSIKAHPPNFGNTPVAESPVDLLLSRLERVRQTGPSRWSASCPGPLHRRGDRSPSLSLATGDDGRVLMRCFAGCSVDAIVTAVGLELSDLFPPRPIAHAGPIPARQCPKISDRDLLTVIRREAAIVATAGEELLTGPLAPPDLERLQTAVRRLFGLLVEAGRHG